MAVGLRHNHDITFLNGTTQSLSMMHYCTNYASKFHSPLFQLMKQGVDVLHRIRASGPYAHGEPEEFLSFEDSTQAFFMKWANKVHTDRKVSSMEIVYLLQGFPTDFTSSPGFSWIFITSVRKWVVSRWRGHPDRAGTGDEGVFNFNQTGQTVDYCQGYLDRGPQLKEICFWEWRGLVDVIRSGCRRGSQRDIPWADNSNLSRSWRQSARDEGDFSIPLIKGFFSPDIEKDEGEEFQRYKLTLPSYVLLPI
ncbi:hypothetical protein QBC39DRAFT_65495 [Podospora conica]|nr:hypothetical protein QBC39DRAFT_65495 [Schizothecium conicum]